MKKITGAEGEKARRRDAKKEVPMVGLFFAVDGKPFTEGIPWRETLSVAGFRTYGVDHPDYWQRLREFGAVPSDMSYEDCPRGRVNYEDASGRFTLFADRCIIRNKRLVSRIVSKLGLPKNTRVVTDSHYRCAKCMGKMPSRKQEREDWDL